jgi:Flp pilus assembly protein TadD
VGFRQDIREGWRQASLAAAVKRTRKLVMEGKGAELASYGQAAADRFPESAELQLMLARGLRQIDRPDFEIAAQATKAATVGARDANIQVQAGFILIDARDVEGARGCVARAEESADEHFIFAVDLDGLKGRVAAVDGEYARAEDLFRSVVLREPQWPENWNQLARFLWARDRDEEALTVLAEALNRARDESGLTAGQLGDLEEIERLQAKIAGEADPGPA